MPYLLDTVTISAFRRPDKTHPNLLGWQKAQRGTIGYVSVVTLNELHYGMRKVESRDPVFAFHLATWYAKIVSLPKQFRVLMVDPAIAELAADFRADHNMPFEDSLIAATAKVHNLTIATRNTAHFVGCGVEIVNPWEAEA
jgi:predicted nucleic acid-binding protein